MNSTWRDADSDAQPHLRAVLARLVPSPTGATSDDTLPDDLLTRFRAAAVAAGLFDADEGPVYADIVMGMLSGTPSAVQDRFEAVERGHGGMEAMRWFYDYCVANNYVKKGVLDKNPRFDSHGLVITINLAKPEFKNMKKAAAGNSVAGGYPACTICHENEGFAGRNKRTLRTIPATLGDEPWFWRVLPVRVLLPARHLRERRAHAHAREPLHVRAPA